MIKRQIYTLGGTVSGIQRRERDHTAAGVLAEGLMEQWPSV